MKIGDRHPINLNEWTVAEAVVVDIEDGKATLEIPATRIVMGIKSSLTDLTPEAPQKGFEVTGTTQQGTIAPAQQAPNTSDTAATQSDSDNASGVAGAPVPAPVQNTTTQPVQPTKFAPDDIGEGLAGVALPEMD